MKRLIPASIIFLFVLGICICSKLCVNKTSDETLNEIKYCYQQLENGNIESAHQLSENIKDNWHKNKEKLELFVNHSFLDKVNLYVYQLPVFIKTNSKNDFLLAYENINTLFEQISEEQKFGMHSFF